MPLASSPAPTRSRSQLAASALFVLCCIFFVGKGFFDESLALHARDFKPVYSGARCLLKHCNAYDSGQIRTVYLEAGGDPADDLPFRPFNAAYPPTTLFWLVPFALLPWKLAVALWLSLSAALFVAAALWTATLCRTYLPGLGLLLLGAFVCTSTILIMLGQPAGPAIGLCVLAVWLLVKRRSPVLSVLCFALSLTLKPHLVGLVWLYFLLSGAEQRRRALQILATTILFCLPGILWASLSPQMAHWPSDLRTNLAEVAIHGNASDPGPANSDAPGITDLQAVVSVVRDQPAFYNPVSYAVSGGLLLLWGYIAVRAPSSRKKDLLGIACISYLCLLPFYHRQYDTRLLLLAFPATCLLLSEGGVAGAGAMFVSLLTILCTNHTYSHIMRQHFAMSNSMPNPPLSALATVLLLRPIPLVLLAGGLFYLACFWRTLHPAPVQ